MLTKSAIPPEMVPPEFSAPVTIVPPMFNAVRVRRPSVFVVRVKNERRVDRVFRCLTFELQLIASVVGELED